MVLHQLLRWNPAEVSGCFALRFSFFGFAASVVANSYFLARQFSYSFSFQFLKFLLFFAAEASCSFILTGVCPVCVITIAWVAGRFLAVFRTTLGIVRTTSLKLDDFTISFVGDIGTSVSSVDGNIGRASGDVCRPRSTGCDDVFPIGRICFVHCPHHPVNQSTKIINCFKAKLLKWACQVS